jgi:N-acetylmuramoyl-L-alanine amidase
MLVVRQNNARRRALTRAAVAVGTIAAVLGSGLAPVAASEVPAPVSGLAATLVPHGVGLTWTASGDGTPVVRDVTGLEAPYTVTSGLALTATATSARDLTRFTNTGTRRYAVFATTADGTPSEASTVDAGPFAVLPTALAVSTPPTAVLSGSTLTLTGRLTYGAGLPLSDALVRVQSRVLGTSTTSLLASARSAADGTVRVALRPTRSRTYQLTYAGDAFTAASQSAVRTTALQPRATLRLKPSIVLLTQRTTINGAVSPSLPGVGVVLQRRVSGVWQRVRGLTLSSASTFTTTMTRPVGKTALRVVLPSRTSYRGALSPTQVLTVVPRNLRLGNQGDDVLALEQRLRSLKYWPGKVDGTFDANTLHAVLAFQKVERLSRTGVWAGKERVRNLAPKGFRLRFPKRSGRSVEVDITRQVMVTARDGVIRRIVDVSTGSGTPYYVDGVKNIAYTPRGTFTIFYKIDGLREAKLGTLYRPSYFYRGWAIHGSGSVPIYPASHGCVRITNPVADLLFDWLTVGTKVSTYDS